MKQLLVFIAVIAVNGTALFLMVHHWFFYRFKKDMSPKKIDFFSIFHYSKENKNAKYSKFSYLLTCFLALVFISIRLSFNLLDT